jgi:transcriptional regulator with XRE-family HTH domain
MSSPTKHQTARERVARNVKLWRKQRGFSQQTLSKEVGLSRTYLSRIENGVETVSVDNLEKLAIVLKVDIVDLLKSDRC